MEVLELQERLFTKSSIAQFVWVPRSHILIKPADEAARIFSAQVASGIDWKEEYTQFGFLAVVS